MQFKISLKQSSFIIGIAGIAFSSIIFLFFGFNLFGQISYAKTVTPVKSVIVSKPTDLSLPVRLKIPKIKVNAIIEHVGLTPQGAVGVPKTPITTAWFNLGPRPGEDGSAVIVGHYGLWKNGAKGIFNNLSKLRKGDKLYVEDGKGSSTTFIVREFRTYNQNDEAPDVFISGDEKAHLNLITCAGVWNKNSKSYNKRLVLFADKE